MVTLKESRQGHKSNVIEFTRVVNWIKLLTLVCVARRTNMFATSINTICLS